jgi:VWFA-related protein
MKRSTLLAFMWFLQFCLATLAQQSNVPQQPAASPSPQSSNATQQPPPVSDEDVVRITTNLVQVDAVVTDRNGRPVTDLKREEIQIFEDGRRQKITHFSYILTESFGPARSRTPATKGTNAPPIPPTRLKPEDVRRTIAIVVDDIGLSSESTYFVRRALKKFVDEQLQPGDLVAIIRTTTGIGALQQFTADKTQLDAAIDRIKWRPGFGGIRAFTPLESDPLSQAIESGGGPAPPADQSAQFRAQVFTVGTLGVVNYVIRGLHELPGRKSVLLISDGLQVSTGGNMLEGFHRLIDQANRASVVIYTMNASGLQTLHFNSRDDYDIRPDPTTPINDQFFDEQLAGRRREYFDKQQGLDYLAQQTGGLAIRNNNDLSGGIRRIIQDQKSYYLIGYRPDESTFDQKTGRRTFHKLILKVTRAGNFNVRMRNGFFGISDQEVNAKPRTPQQQIFAALASPFGSEGVHVHLTSLFANDAKRGSYMRSLLHFDARDLTFSEEPDGSRKARIDLLAITFGGDGNPVEQISGAATLRVPGPKYQIALRDGILYFVTVPIKKPGVYQLRVAVRDESSERVGSASQFVEVPDIKNNRLTLSGIILEGTSLTTTKPAGASEQASTVNTAQNGEGEVINSVNSAAVRQFHVGEVVQYAFAVYNAHPDKVTGQPKVQLQMRLFRSGQPLSAPTAQPLNLGQQQDMKRLTVTGGMRLGSDLAPGEYVLQVIATDPLTDEKHRVATQWIDFEIVK